MPYIIIALVLIGLIGYLWGSLPSGYWMGKLLRGRDFDIRDHGSHKTGATNVQRSLGNIPALMVLLLDLSKGIGPVAIATFVPFLNAAGWGPTVAGLLALLGHCFPVFLEFKGGRGVSTGGGAIVFISPLTFVCTFVMTVGTILLTRYVSLGSIIGSLTSVVCGVLFFVLGLLHPDFFGRVTLAQMVYLVIAPLIVVYLHSDNISRLRAGTERKFGQKETKNAPVGSSPNIVKSSASNI